jgi:protein-disulfide isomerase
MRHLHSLAVLTMLLPSSGAIASAMLDEESHTSQRIREILLKNPEIIRDVIIELNKRDSEAKRQQIAKIIEEEKAALYETHRGYTIGDENASIAVVALFDYNCSFCKSALSPLSEISREYGVKILVKDYPVLGADSIEASKIALAAHKLLSRQGFEEFHRRLLAIKGSIGKEAALALASETGLSRNDLEDLAQGFQADFNETVRIAEKLGVKGTPTFMIGDTLFSGLGDLEALKSSIRAMQKCGRAMC